MISISGAPPNSLSAGPPAPPYYDNYSGPANPACFLTLDSVNDWAGQSFTTTTKYNLAQIELWCKKGPGSDIATIYVEVWAVDGNGHPTGQALARGTILNADVSEDYSWVSCDMDTFSFTYYMLSAATKYCIVVQGTAALDVDNTFVWACGGDGSDYPNGDQEWSINGGDTWTTDTERDQLFRCYTSDFIDNYSGRELPFVALKLDSANDWLGQSFTAMKSYTLGRIDIWCEKGPGDNVGDITVALYHVDENEHPDIVGGVLATGIIHNVDIPETPPAWIRCDLSPYNVSVDTKYAIVIHGVSLTPAINLFVFYDNHSGLSDYDGGDTEWSTTGGAAWATTTTFDVMFRCYIA